MDADIAMTAVGAGFYFNGLAAMAGGVLVGAASLAARRTGLLPGWLAILGYVVAVASIPAALAGMWILVEAAWIVLAAGVLAARASRFRPLRWQALRLSTELHREGPARCGPFAL